MSDLLQPHAHQVAIFAAIALLHVVALVTLSLPGSRPPLIAPSPAIEASIIGSPPRAPTLVLPQATVDLRAIQLDTEVELPRFPNSTADGPPIESPVDLDSIPVQAETKLVETLSPPKPDPRFPLPSADAFYPHVSEQTHEQGIVRVSVFIQTDGSIGTARVEQSSGSARLDEAAMRYAWTVRWVPGRRGDHASNLWLSLELVFDPCRSFVRFPNSGSPPGNTNS